MKMQKTKMHFRQRKRLAVRLRQRGASLAAVQMRLGHRNIRADG